MLTLHKYGLFCYSQGMLLLLILCRPYGLRQLIDLMLSDFLQVPTTPKFPTFRTNSTAPSLSISPPRIGSARLPAMLPVSPATAVAVAAGSKEPRSEFSQFFFSAEEMDQEYELTSKRNSSNLHQYVPTATSVLSTSIVDSDDELDEEFGEQMGTLNATVISLLHTLMNLCDLVCHK